MIQDIAPHVYDNAYRPVQPEESSLILSYRKGNILVRMAEAGEQRQFAYPRLADFPELRREELQWLFQIDGEAYFLAEKPLAEANGFAYVPIRFMRSAQPRYQAFAGTAGFSLDGWYRRHQYCGQCGTPLQHSETERMVYCPDCGAMFYPQICPAVIVAVCHGDRLLVSTYAGRSYKNIALLAGFAEIGESIEDTVHREVMEETGVRVKNLRFYKSQPWCFTDTLLFGFFCDLDGEDTLQIDHHELASAQWMTRHDLPDDTEKASLTMEMITLFKQGMV